MSEHNRLGMRTLTVSVLGVLISAWLIFVVSGIGNMFFTKQDQIIYATAITYFALIVFGVYLISRQTLPALLRTALVFVFILAMGAGSLFASKAYRDKLIVEAKLQRSLADYAKSPTLYFDAKVHDTVLAFSDPVAKKAAENTTFALDKLMINLYKVGHSGITETKLDGRFVGREVNDPWSFVFGADAEYTDSPSRFVSVYDQRGSEPRKVEVVVDRVPVPNTYMYIGRFTHLGTDFDFTRWTCYPRSLSSRVDGMLFALNIYQNPIDTLQVNFYSCESVAKISLQIPGEASYKPDAGYAYYPVTATESFIPVGKLPSANEIDAGIDRMGSAEFVFGYSFTVVSPENKPYVLMFSLGGPPLEENVLPKFESKNANTPKT